MIFLFSQFLEESFYNYEKYVEQGITLKKEATSIKLKPKSNAMQHFWTMTERKSSKVMHGISSN